MLDIITLFYLLGVAFSLTATAYHGIEHSKQLKIVFGTMLLCFIWPIFILMGIVWANNMAEVIEERKHEE